MKLFEVEQVVTRADIETEDGGCAKIMTFSGEETCTDAEHQNFEDPDGMFVRVQSWSDFKQHTDFDKMVGKRVKVTVELLD